MACTYPADSEEIAVATSILQAFSTGTRVIGFWGSNPASGFSEYSGVYTAGLFGLLTVVADWNSNLSLLSGMDTNLTVALAAYQQRRDCSLPALDATKVYLAMQVVDSGDSPAYWQYQQYKVWDDPGRGSVPIGWGVGWGVAELAPAIAEHFIEAATPRDYLLGAMSGAAYVAPYRQLMAQTPRPGSAWAGYTNLTDTVMARLGASQTLLYTDAWTYFNRSVQDPVSRRFGTQTCEAGGTNMLVLGMGRDDGVAAPDNNYRLPPPPSCARPGTIVSHVMTRWNTSWTQMSREEGVAWLVRDIQQQVASCSPLQAPLTAPGADELIRRNPLPCPVPTSSFPFPHLSLP